MEMWELNELNAQMRKYKFNKTIKKKTIKVLESEKQFKIQSN